MNLAEFADRFKAPLIRDALKYLFVQSEFACTSVFFILAGYNIRSAGFPSGGSLSLAKKLESKLLAMDGKIHYTKRVKRIIVDNDKATGVELFDGSVHNADIVISAANGYATLFNMLEDKFTTPVLRDRFDKESLYSSFIQVSFGVNRDMASEPHSIKVKTDQPFEIAGQMRDELWYHHLSFDPTMAPEGKATVIVHYPSNYEWWEKFPYDSSKYKSEKHKILDTTIAQLEKLLPGISVQIEISDVSTPYTIHRYTSNWKAVPGFSMTKTLAGKMTLNPQYCLPNLKKFYMTGQWVKGFGVPMGAMCGKEVIQKVCKNENIRFKI
jgi:phytoene dehydrogenase-like protein